MANSHKRPPIKNISHCFYPPVSIYFVFIPIFTVSTTCSPQVNQPFKQYASQLISQTVSPSVNEPFKHSVKMYTTQNMRRTSGANVKVHEHIIIMPLIKNNLQGSMDSLLQCKGQAILLLGGGGGFGLEKL